MHKCRMEDEMIIDKGCMEHFSKEDLTVENGCHESHCFITWYIIFQSVSINLADMQIIYFFVMSVSWWNVFFASILPMLDGTMLVCTSLCLQICSNRFPPILSSCKVCHVHFFPTYIAIFPH